jgi:sec-independent protein translocase protein TatA
VLLPALIEKEKKEYSSPIMFGFGIGELILILLIVLVVFGANKLPGIGEGLGKGIQNFRKTIKSPDSIDVTPEKKADEQADEKH